MAKSKKEAELDKLRIEAAAAHAIGALHLITDHLNAGETVSETTRFGITEVASAAAEKLAEAVGLNLSA